MLYDGDTPVQNGHLEDFLNHSLLKHCPGEAVLSFGSPVIFKAGPIARSLNLKRSTGQLFPALFIGVLCF
jgi:hypothetical protein